MPNKNYNDVHSKDKIDNTSGKKGSGKEKTVNNIYGNNVSFGTGLTDKGDTINNLGGKGKFNNC